MEEYIPLTHSSSGFFSITYDKYFMMIQKACIRYDKTMKLKPSTTSRTVYQHEIDEDPSVHDAEDDYLDDNFAPEGMDTPADDIYNIHNTNINRSPHVKSLIPRRPPGKPKSNKSVPLKPGYNGHVYLLKHTYNMLSDDFKQELVKCNQEKKLNTSLHVPEWPRSMSKIMMRLTTHIVPSLILQIIS